jgi:type I restriction enzyme S subunit
MRNGWIEIALGELTKDTRPICYGVLKPGPQVDGGVPLVKITDMDRRILGPEGMQRISKELDDEFRRSRLRGGEVLLSIQGTVGRVAIAASTLKGANISRTIAVIDPDDRLLNVYLMYVLEKIATQGDFDSAGSTRDSLNISTIRGMKILCPPILEQKRIVDLISSVDSYIEALQQQLENAQRSRNAVLHELMTARGNDWVVRKLPEVVEVLDRMRKPINSTEREDRKGNIPYYGANGQTGWIDEFIFNEELVLLGEDAIDFADPSARKAYLIQGPSWVNNHAHVLRADKTIINSYFLMESLNKVDYSQYVSFGTRSKLTQASMNGIKVLVPSMKNQEKIVDLLANFDEVIEATQKSIGDSKVLRSSMLSNLLSGEHEIPTSYDKFIGAA